MDRTFKFVTDTATLAVFDPQQLEHRVNDDVDWWCLDFSQLDEVQAGKIALFSLGGDGVYQLRITDGDLNREERDYAAELVANLGINVTSGNVFFGAGECVPGGESKFEDFYAHRGKLLEIKNGMYRVDAYAIHWFDSPRWWTEEQNPPADAPADFVIVLRPRTASIPAIDSEPRFNGVADGFMFESSTRQVGPQPGMILTTKVRKGPNGLALQDCGPCNYRASLIDYSQVAWKDTVRFKVISVDPDAKEMTGEYIETLKGA